MSLCFSLFCFQRAGEIEGVICSGEGDEPYDVLDTPTVVARASNLLGKALVMIECWGPIIASTITPSLTLFPYLWRVMDMPETIA